MLTAPAIYYGQAGDAATIRAGNLIWNGAAAGRRSTTAPAPARGR